MSFAQLFTCLALSLCVMLPTRALAQDWHLGIAHGTSPLGPLEYDLQIGCDASSVQDELVESGRYRCG